MTNDYIHNDLTTQHFLFTLYFVIYGQPNKVRFFIQGKGKEKGHRNLEHLRYVSIPTVVPAMNSCYP